MPANAKTPVAPAVQQPDDERLLRTFAASEFVPPAIGEALGRHLALMESLRRTVADRDPARLFPIVVSKLLERFVAQVEAGKDEIVREIQAGLLVVEKPAARADSGRAAHKPSHPKKPRGAKGASPLPQKLLDESPAGLDYKAEIRFRLHAARQEGEDSHERAVVAIANECGCEPSSSFRRLVASVVASGNGGRRADFIAGYLLRSGDDSGEYTARLSRVLLTYEMDRDDVIAQAMGARTWEAHRRRGELPAWAKNLKAAPAAS